MIVGVAGLYCSGKDTFAEYLVQKGFTHLSLSDFLRAKLKAQKKEINRDNLIVLGNELRAKFGQGVLAMMALDTMEPEKNYVISSIRHPVEVEVLKKRNNFVLAWVHAPASTRWQRMQARGKGAEELPTYEAFMKSEKQEQSNDPSAQQLHKIPALADVIIRNTGTLEELHSKIDKFLAEWMPKLNKRPDWDEYFIGIMQQVGKRATCDRGKSGAVIVKDKRLLSTGYVGAPVGLAHCDEAGHEFSLVQNDDGTTSVHCVRTTHAEQNAIVQAARHGIRIEGATIYCKMEPCYACAKMIINAGIKRVVCEKRYHRAQRTREIFKQAGIQLHVIHDKIEQYPGQEAKKL